jgi:hypothetical protein
MYVLIPLLWLQGHGDGPAGARDHGECGNGQAGAAYEVNRPLAPVEYAEAAIELIAIWMPDFTPVRPVTPGGG